MKNIFNFGKLLEGESMNADEAYSGYFKASDCTMECRCPLDEDLIFRKVEKKIKQDERVEQTKSMAEEEGIYFY